MALGFIIVLVHPHLNNMKKAALIWVQILFLAAALVAQTNVESFDKYVESARQQWHVPGLSIVVVKDGKVVFEKGYGVRELGKSDPVTTDTLFGSMSTTKAMTVACLSMLIDEGKVNLDDKVIKYLPDFRVADPYITNELRVRDLLTHSGGPRRCGFSLGLDAHDRKFRSCSADAICQTRLLDPQQLYLSEHHVSGRRAGDRKGERYAVGAIHR